MQFVIPNTVDLLRKRDALLQSSLRPEGLPFSLPEEYPLVLKPNRHQYSVCALDDTAQVIAHANLWPRVLMDETQAWQLAIGLVGNVATRTDQRGRGVMRELFAHLEKEAKALNLQGLLLWSDLNQFYQKLGFRSLSREYRLFFNSTTLGNSCLGQPKKFFCVEAGKLNDMIIENIMALRFPTGVTIKRSRQEYLELLRIPSTYLYLLIENGNIVSFCIVGKGYDLINVVHEWGSKTIEDLLIGLRDIAFESEFKELMLLMPGDMEEKIKNQLVAAADRIETHAMALARVFTQDETTLAKLERCFVWGLDSI